MKKEAMLYEKTTGNKVLCLLCSHACEIADSKYGICGVRKNEKGKLFTHVYGEVIASHVDPIEKKPLFHFFPGTKTFSIATVGCNFNCGFCQNWQISQAAKALGESRGRELAPPEVAREAKKNNCKSISYTYTEPTIFFEYAYDTARLAKAEGLYNTFVTNGYMTEKALDTIKPYLDACNVDLKFFKDESYKKICKGSLEPVFRSIRHMKEIGIWVEITTLVVPGLNDSDKELKDIAQFIKSIGVGTPWHISRYHPDYQYRDPGPTPPATLQKAEAIGKAAGLKYIYLGNVAEEGNTYCPKCEKLLIKRIGYKVEILDQVHTKDKPGPGLRCPSCSGCGTVTEGVW